MSRWQLVFRSLVHHGRNYLTVMLGVAVATAVLTGALLVGDSMRGSLRRIAVERLGRIDFALLGQRFFREELAGELSRAERFEDLFAEVLPAIVLNGTVERSVPEPRTRSGGVTVVGCDDNFWQLGDGAATPDNMPKEFEVIVNGALAKELGLQIGNEINVQLAQASDIPGDSPLARKSGVIEETGQLKIVDIVPARGIGRFSLSPSQQQPLCVFLPRRTLAQMLDRSGKVNALLIAGNWADGKPSLDAESWLRESLRPSLDDLGFGIKHVRQTAPGDDGEEAVVFDYYSLYSNQMLLSDDAAAAAQQALAADNAEPLYTYLATTIARGEFSHREVAKSMAVAAIFANPAVQATWQPIIEDWMLCDVPYSTVTAIDPAVTQIDLIGKDGNRIAEFANDEILINSWTADQLGAKVGDTIALDFFEPESAHGKVIEQSAQFRLAGIVPLSEPTRPFMHRRGAQFGEKPPTIWNDPDFTPTVPGITDRRTIDDWDAPFPYESSRIRTQDDKYWNDHRTTPKAFITLAKGQELWGSRFGSVTSFRIPAAEGVSESTIEQKFLGQLRRDQELLDLRLLPLKQKAIDASSGTTPFDGLFIGFSMFLIAAALMLVSLLFRLRTEQRAEEIGILLAVGFSRKTVRRLLLIEGLLVAIVGAVAGLLLGVGYAWLMIEGLKTLWVAAIVTPFLDVFITGKSLGIGFGVGVATVMVTIFLSIRGLRNVPVRRLVAGQASPPPVVVAARFPVSLVIAAVLFFAAVGLAAYAATQRGEAQAGAFFGAGAAVLTSLLLLLRRQMRDWTIGSFNRRANGPRATSRGQPDGLGVQRTDRLSLFSLAMRNAARNPGRSTLTVGLTASATFLIVAISAFQLQPSEEGAGGFDLMAQTDQPILLDLNTKEARQHYDFDADDLELLEQATVFPLRLRSGDDASCLNLFRPQQPRVLGVSREMVDYFTQTPDARFAFAASAAKTAEQRSNPWTLLNRARTDCDKAVPVILDQATAMYSLQLYGGVGQVFEIEDDWAGGTVRLQVVGLLKGSVLQGNLLISMDSFEELYPQISGYRFYLIRSPDGKTDQVASLLEEKLAKSGFDATRTTDRLEALNMVQNTYLSTFQSIGALGLLLGTFGLATVQLRSVFERRGELALLRAAGFRRRRLAWMVLLENSLLLLAGLSIGVLAALITTVPHVLFGGATVPIGTLAILLGIVFVVGILTGLMAVRATLKAPLIPALRGA
jgi:putative ABC transport system permease protein